MAWINQYAPTIGLFLEAHPPFDAAIGIVIMMLMLSVVFTLINRPERAVDDPVIKSALERFKTEPDQAKLLWEYALHSDAVFNDRQNFFLLFESILLGGSFAIVEATLQGHSRIPTVLLTMVSFVGLLTTVSWWYVQVRQEHILDCLTEFHKRVTPAYGDAILRIRQRPYRVGSTVILVYVLPLIVSCLWTAILAYV